MHEKPLAVQLGDAGRSGGLFLESAGLGLVVGDLLLAGVLGGLDALGLRLTLGLNAECLGFGGGAGPDRLRLGQRNRIEARRAAVDLLDRRGGHGYQSLRSSWR